jgi:hypothetical protein
VEEREKLSASSTRVRERPNATIALIQRRINDSLEADLAETLAAPFFRGFRVRIVRVSLSAAVQAAVDDTQARYAAVNGAGADLRSARYHAERHTLLGDSYNRSPSLVSALNAIRPAHAILVQERPPTSPRCTGHGWSPSRTRTTRSPVQASAGTSRLGGHLVSIAKGYGCDAARITSLDALERAARGGERGRADGPGGADRAGDPLARLRTFAMHGECDALEGLGLFWETARGVTPRTFARCSVAFTESAVCWLHWPPSR